MAGWMLLPICGCLGVFGLCALYAWGLARIAGEADARRPAPPDDASKTDTDVA